MLSRPVVLAVGTLDPPQSKPTATQELPPLQPSPVSSAGPATDGTFMKREPRASKAPPGPERIALAIYGHDLFIADRGTVGGPRASPAVAGDVTEVDANTEAKIRKISGPSYRLWSCFAAGRTDRYRSSPVPASPLTTASPRLACWPRHRKGP